jgi:hypothetical protein
MRAMVVVKLTGAAGKAIPASEFSFAVFGPIFCGTVAGCGGAFLPLNKGLDPIKEHGLAPPMLSAFIAATFYHLFTNLVSEDIIDAPKKAHVAVSAFFILYGMYYHGVSKSLTTSAPVKKSETPKEAPKKKAKAKVKKES